MPETTPEISWWIMTGAIAALLSLLTMGVAIIGYLLSKLLELIKEAFQQLFAKIDRIQEREALRDKEDAEHRAVCLERHKALDDTIGTIKQQIREAA
jgi:hypothetical protein